ncbi:2TM domain-containing protein [Aquimarina sp. D1M17]|uniref:2TM domain-containing protein n=1 Tax=Aquimarina acroporae TaxID=2937283 RepID=UPI0020C0B29B|nr:2TM domain-containing protein [Aquimarina acroporae]MCK8522887.1 2TM domain-containing protein [Aquimarina acroporae]
MTNQIDQKLYKKAKRRLNEEKGFYVHLAVYIGMNIIMAVILFQLKANLNVDDEEFKRWLMINLVLIPTLWGIVLLGHGLWTFKQKQIKKKLKNWSLFSKSWEERKINEYMDKDQF